MNPGQLDPHQKAAIDVFLAQPRLARLATSDPATLQPHLTAVWFDWDGKSLLISVYNSTRKARELQKNPRCAVLVDLEEEGPSPRAVLLEGAAELISEPRAEIEAIFTRIYTRYLGETGVLAKDPQEWIHSPENVLVKLTPEQIYTW